MDNEIFERSARCASYLPKNPKWHREVETLQTIGDVIRIFAHYVYKYEIYVKLIGENPRKYQFVEKNTSNGEFSEGSLPFVIEDRKPKFSEETVNTYVECLNLLDENCRGWKNTLEALLVFRHIEIYMKVWIIKLLLLLKRMVKTFINLLKSPEKVHTNLSRVHILFWLNKRGKTWL